MQYSRYEKLIENIKSSNGGISIRKLSTMQHDTIYVLYIKQITDRNMVSEYIIKPLLEHLSDSKITINYIAESIIYSDDITIECDENNIIDNVLNGKSVILLNSESNYIVSNTTKVEKRGIQVPEMQYTIRGPRDAFIENIDSNLSLVRYRLKNPDFKVEMLKVGKNTKTNVAMVYIGGTADSSHVSIIRNGIQNIKIDNVFESSYIQNIFEQNSKSLFPKCNITERPDTLCSSILEGKIALFVEGSNTALIFPSTFWSYIDSPDDHYTSTYMSIMQKSIRVISIIITMTLSSLYIALVAFNPDILPATYIIAIAVGRAPVPYNALIEVLIMETISEILREASIRLPKQIGSAIGIVGTIVIGQAAISAGLTSPLMVIFLALSNLTSYVAPDYTIMNPIRFVRFLLIIISSFFGVYGFIMGFTFIVINILKSESLGVPYLAPFIPPTFKDIKEYLYASIFSKSKSDYLNPQNK